MPENKVSVEELKERKKGEEEKRVEENKILKHLEKTNPNWDDLTEEQKEIFSYFYNRIIKSVISDINYKINPKLEELDQRTETRVSEMDSIHDFVQENDRAVVDVWSTGCVPCNLVTPVLEKLVRKEDEIAFGTKKWDEECKSDFDISTLPTILLFENGEVRKRIEGAPPSNYLEAEVETLKVPKEKFKEKLKFAKTVAKERKWRVNPDPKIRNMLLVGLIKNEEKFGLPLCPCKTPVDENGEVIKKNVCPCQKTDNFLGSEEEIKRKGHCFCGLFLDKNWEGNITEDYVLKHFEKPAQ